MPRVALISMPFSPWYYTPYQLGTLKAFLRKRGIEAETMNYYVRFANEMLKRGMKDSYDKLVHFYHLGDYLSLSLFDPVHFELNYQDLFRLQEEGEYIHYPRPTSREFKAIRRLLKKCLNDWLSERDWGCYRLIGFTTSHLQLVSSLCLARSIKSRYPDVAIVFGGYPVFEKMGAELLKKHLFIDYMVSGEGEQPLYQLAQRLLERRPKVKPGRSRAKIPGVLERCGEQIVSAKARQRVVKTLVEPDYYDYFSTLARAAFLPQTCTATVEGSRGCYWNKCDFCSFNISYRGYRSFSPRRVVSIIRNIRDKYGCTSFAFVDTAVKQSFFKEMYAIVGEEFHDLSIFAEVRPGFSRGEVETLRRLGIKTVETGVECFTDTLLKKMNKGTTLMQNIEMITYCYEAGIWPHYNLVTRHPMESKNDLKDYEHNVRCLTHLPPPTYSQYHLHYGSELYKECERFSRAIRYDKLFDRVFTRDISSVESRPSKMAVVGSKKHEASWRNLLRIMDRWRNRFETTRYPLLYFRRGKGFLTIYDYRGEGLGVVHCRGNEARIYETCRVPMTVEKLRGTISRGQKNLEGLLTNFVERGLMYELEGRYFSLALDAARFAYLPIDGRDS